MATEKTLILPARSYDLTSENRPRFFLVTTIDEKILEQILTIRAAIADFEQDTGARPIRLAVPFEKKDTRLLGLPGTSFWTSFYERAVNLTETDQFTEDQLAQLWQRSKSYPLYYVQAEYWHAGQVMCLVTVTFHPLIAPLTRIRSVDIPISELVGLMDKEA